MDYLHVIVRFEGNLRGFRSILSADVKPYSDCPADVAAFVTIWKHLEDSRCNAESDNV